jgi:peroxiredoxin
MLRQASQGALLVDSVKLGDEDAEKAVLDAALKRAAEGKTKFKKAPSSTGDHVPHVIFKARVRDESIGGDNPFKWKNVSTNDLFKGKRVVLFALPGAFTPTCSTTHVPGYEKHYDEIRALGIDEVYCLSVNDAFVMRQWGISLGLEKEDADDSNPLNPGNFKKVKFIPDGACEFTRGMGMSCIWDTERGFGERSWRYSAVISDLKIEKIFIEGGAVLQNSEADPFEVSNAETMLGYLQEHSKK